MPSLFEDRTRAAIEARLEKLTPESKARWGKFTAATMVAHLMDTVAYAFNEKSVTVNKVFSPRRWGSG